MDLFHFYLQHCLPNCEEIRYTSTLSAAPFRRCDFKTLGINPLCDPSAFEETDEGLSGINPPIWGTSAFNNYRQAKLMSQFMVFRYPRINSFVIGGYGQTHFDQYIIIFL